MILSDRFSVLKHVILKVIFFFVEGQDTFSGGFMGACFGGVLCASAILHRNIYDDLLKLRKDINKTK